jgi:hypothetical protein
VASAHYAKLARMRTDVCHVSLTPH